MSGAPAMSVVVCSLNGADGLQRVLRGLARQSIVERLEVVVVDDGSTDNTAGVAEAAGAVVERHPENRGLAAARNTGIRAARAPIVAFLDDDCEPGPGWAETLLSAYDADDVVGAGGVVEPRVSPTTVGRFHERNNPLAPLEFELVHSEALPYRILLYLRRLWSTSAPEGRRPVHSLVGANMSFRREALMAAGMFDGRFRFGSEELDVCRSVLAAHPGARLVVEPTCIIDHHFDSSLRDMLRRSYAYGVGNARYFRKWPSVRPTIFPFPFVFLAAAAAATRRPRIGLALPLLPFLMFPKALRSAAGIRRMEPLVDAPLTLANEAAGVTGYVAGLWRFRDFEPATETAAGVADVGA